jgi:hypothetical protein
MNCPGKINIEKPSTSNPSNKCGNYIVNPTSRAVNGRLRQTQGNTEWQLKPSRKTHSKAKDLANSDLSFEN